MSHRYGIDFHDPRYEGGTSPLMLEGRWSSWTVSHEGPTRGSNPASPRYKGGASPLMLEGRRSSTDRIEREPSPGNAPGVRYIPSSALPWSKGQYSRAAPRGRTGPSWLATTHLTRKT